MASIAFLFHLLASVIWIGGMFFAYLALRPVAADILEPPVRLKLWLGVFKRFFFWVWLSVIVLPISGYWMVFSHFGGMANVSMAVHVMQLLGWFMIAIFCYVYFAPYRKMATAFQQQEFPQAAASLNRIRQLIAFNLSLGLIIVLLMGVNRFW